MEINENYFFTSLSRANPKKVSFFICCLSCSGIFAFYAKIFTSHEIFVVHVDFSAIIFL